MDYLSLGFEIFKCDCDRHSFRRLHYDYSNRYFAIDKFYLLHYYLLPQYSVLLVLYISVHTLVGISSYEFSTFF